MASISDDGDYFPVALPQKQVMAAVERMLQQLAPGQVRMNGGYNRASIGIDLAEKARGNVFVDVDPPVGGSADTACRVRVMANVTGQAVQPDQVEEAHRFTCVFHEAIEATVAGLLAGQQGVATPSEDRELG